MGCGMSVIDFGVTIEGGEGLGKGLEPVEHTCYTVICLEATQVKALAMAPVATKRI